MTPIPKRVALVRALFRRRGQQPVAPHEPAMADAPSSARLLLIVLGISGRCCRWSVLLARGACGLLCRHADMHRAPMPRDVVHASPCWCRPTTRPMASPTTLAHHHTRSSHPAIVSWSSPTTAATTPRSARAASTGAEVVERHDIDAARQGLCARRRHSSSRNSAARGRAHGRCRLRAVTR